MMDAAAVVARIADQLVATAFHDDDECTWLTRVQSGGGPMTPASYVVQSMTSELYGGAAGVALFLARWSAVSGDPRARETACAAVRFAVRRAHRMSPRFRRALYTGRFGTAWAAVEVGRATGDDALVALARPLLDTLAEDHADDALLDVISGDAGAVGPWLGLAAALDAPHYRDAAFDCAGRVATRAGRDGDAWHWGEESIGFPIAGPLTGYAHGASGMAIGLLEAATASGDPTLFEAARGAFTYEARRFDATAANWPDLRFFPDGDATAVFGNAWCVGAPGVALARVRALELLGEEPALRHDLTIGVDAIHRYAARVADTGDTDFSLCHGWGGLGDILLESRRIAPTPAIDALLARIAAEGIARHGDDPAGWRCGLREGSTPSLLLGLAGIGHFYLRLAVPDTPSVLLVRPA
jgi:lantibiotic modifying enzyme